MGISGLLPLLKSIQNPCKLHKFAGQTIGVDAYGWLHRGTVACAIDLALGKPTRKYVDFSMHRVRMLIHFGLIPYLVFDGDYLPSKAATESDRSRRRAESKQKGLELYRMNKPSQAHLELQKAVEVTPAMARELIEELKKANIQYIVAPYEADAQLVYLERQGLIQGMISEDSDLLVFGAKRLLTKLDQFGDCIEIDRSNFASCSAISLTDWSDEEFRRMAILSGCDYLSSISGMGLKNAYRLVRKYKSIEKILRMLQFDGKFHVDPGYLDAFRKADLTFQYQRVFCPTQKKIVTLTEVPKDSQLGDLHFVGPQIDRSVAAAVARGDLDPMTKAPIVRLKQGLYSATPLNRSIVAKQEGTPLAAISGNKSLDSFFKSQKRTPLAELDPNQFTPSPSQQQLSRQNAGVAWESPSVSAPTPTRSTTSVRNVEVTSTPPYIANEENARKIISSFPNSKRRRLLDDAENEATGTPALKIHHERSPFFKSEAQLSKSGLKSGSIARTCRQKDFKIWSEEPTRTLTPDGLAITDKETMPNEKQVESSVKIIGSAGTSVTQCERHNQAECSNSKQRQKNSEIGTPPTSSSASTDSYEEGDSAAATLDRNVITQLRSLTSQQTYQKKPTSDSTACAMGAATPIDAIQYGGRIKPSVELHDVGQRSTTPLQRIRAGAFGHCVSSSQPLHQSTKAGLRRSTSSTLARLPVTPRLPLNRSIGPDASRDKGSEDFIIPDSDEDLDPEVGEGNRGVNRSIDLGRFVFRQ